MKCMAIALLFSLLAVEALGQWSVQRLREYRGRDDTTVYLRITCKKADDGKPGVQGIAQFSVYDFFGFLIDVQTYEVPYCPTPEDIAKGEKRYSLTPVPQSALSATLPSPSRGLAFIANSTGTNGRREIFALNIATNQATAPIDTGDRAFGGVVLAPDGSRLYAVLGPSDRPGSSDPAYVAYIDPATNAITDRVLLQGLTGVRKPEISPDGRWLYFAAGASGSAAPRVQVLDVAAKTLAEPLPVPPSPANVPLSAPVISPDGALLCAQAIHGLHCYDTRTRTYAGLFAIASVPTTSVRPVFHPNGSRMYVFVRELVGAALTYSVAVVDAGTLRLITKIPLPNWPQTNAFGPMAITPDGTRLFVDDAADGKLHIINTRTNRVIQVVEGLTTGSLGAGIILR